MRFAKLASNACETRVSHINTPHAVGAYQTQWMNKWILLFQIFFIMWILNVCMVFAHNNDTEENKMNKFFVELYQDC